MLFELKQQHKDKFNIQKFWQNVDKIVHKTTITLTLPLKWRYTEYFKLNNGESNCFHIIGFDILMDDQFKLWLLEINDSPSFSIDSKVDFDVKSNVIETTLQILGILNQKSNHKDDNNIPFESNLYSFDEKATLKARYRKFKLPLPTSKWYRHSAAILHQHKSCKHDHYLFRLFEDPLLKRIFNAYSTRYGYMNATKWIQFCEDFGLCGFVRCPRSHLDLLFREYQTKICGRGGGEVDLEGFCHVLLMVVGRKITMNKSKDKSVLNVWLEMIQQIFIVQKTGKTLRCCN